MSKIAVVGGGYWGKNLIRNFHELGVLSVICDSNKDLLKDYRSRYKGVKLTSEFRDVLTDKDVSGVVIALPAVEHYNYAMMCLEHDKDVFVEKPLALNVYEAERLVEAAGKKKRILMVGHILQYHPAVNKLKKMISSGSLGKIQYIYSNRLNIGKIRTEENILWSFAPHDISMIIMLLGEMPDRIYATGGSHLQPGIIDETVTTMGFKSGVKAHIFVSWLHPFKEQKLVVVGDSKMVVFDDTTQEKLFSYSHKIEWKGRVPVASKAKPEIIKFKNTEEPLKAECRAFLNSIKTRKRPKTDGNEGVNVLKVLNSCQESLNRGGEVLSVASGKKEPDYFIHATSEVDRGVDVGEGTYIWHFSHVMKGSKVGKNCRIGQNVVIGPNAVVGNGCKIQNNVSVYEGVKLEDHVFCGPSMVFTNVINPRSKIVRKNEYRDTVVKTGASIGANATVICGNDIGKYAFVGAGAVVTKNVPDYALVLGNPARQVGWMCECGNRVSEVENKKSNCPVCGLEYELRGSRLRRKQGR